MVAYLDTAGFKNLTIMPSSDVDALEAMAPGFAFYVCDELGRLRRHVNVFVNGKYGQEDTPVAPDDRVHVLPSITGG